MGHEKIPMPTEAEKQQAIARILDAGLPRRTALDRELWEVLQCVGPRALLFGVGDCLALSLLIWALCLLPALFVASSVGTLAPALFLFSPLLYATLSLLCQRLRGPAGWLAAPVCWATLGLVPLIWPRAAEWLTAVPTVLFCLLAAAGITMYLLELRCFCRRPMEGGVSYALR